MQRIDPQLRTMFAAAALVASLGACSSDPVGGDGNARSSSFFARPDWVTFSGSKDEFSLRPVTTADLIGPEGQCAGGGQDPAASSTDGGPPVFQGGIALQMTECEVVRRAGAPDKIDFATGDSGERAVNITYARGPRPGIYRFSSGRLNLIERTAEPPAPAKAKRPAKSAKTTGGL